jgi:tRNA nucleotidyltransferase (CCA-adding enzyme)
MKFLKDVIEGIKPDKGYEKKILSGVSSIISKINKKLKDGRAVLGGSGAKGTWLKTFDADIFVKFDYNKYRENDKVISDILEKLLKKTFKNVARLHGSRDYFQLRQKGFTFEIVPILDIKKAEQAKNITDVSPLHAKWVLRHKSLQDEMRLLKQFCKAQGVYGAESHIMGFSGYVCEILAVYYGSFLKVVKGAAKWKDKEVIDVEGHYKRRDVFRELNKSKLISPLIVVDPVQADRNAAAALSFENFDRFRKACRSFLKSPSKKFFEKGEFSIEKIREKNKNRKVIFLEVEPLRGKRDVIGCKLVKVLEFVNKKLIENDFKVFEHGWHWNRKAVFYFVVGKETLSENVERRGPLLSAKEHVKAFKKKHKRTFVRGNRIFAVDKRRFRRAEALIKSLFKDYYLEGKVKSIKFTG